MTVRAADLPPLHKGRRAVKLQKIYDAIIQEGIKKDPRDASAISAKLKEEKEKYDKLDAKKKKVFDKDRLVNPFYDSRILYGDPNTEVKTMIVGIDMEVGEIVLADRLCEKGKKIDLVLGHHPDGHALATFYRVMELQNDVLVKNGVSISAAEHLTSERMSEVSRSVAPANHMRSVDAARLLNMPLMCAHTPADNHVYSYLQNLFDKKKPKKLKDILDLLNKEPEYHESAKNNCAPRLISGSPENSAGKIMVDMTGGTEGSRNMFASLANGGVSTLVCMHLSEAHLKKAKEARLNVVIAGHIASDNLGLNLLLDSVVKKEKIKILEASGFRRFSRLK